jgi:hypothetical protein
MWPWILTFLAAYLAIAMTRDLFVILPDASNDETVKEWLKGHPHHFWLNLIDSLDEDTGVPLGVFSFMGGLGLIIVMALYFFTGFEKPSVFQPQLISAMISAIGTYLGLEVASYIYRKHTFSALVKKLWTNQLLAYRNWQKNRMNNPIKQAQHYYRQLLGLIEGKDQEKPLEPVLKKFQQLIKDELPRLLKRSKQLDKFIQQTAKAIARQKANGICPGEAEELKKAQSDLDDFHENKKEVANKIELILAIIDLAKAEVGRIIDAINAREEEQVHSLISQIQSELNLLTQTEAELNELRGKYLHQEVQAQAAAVAEVQAVVEQVSTKVRPPKVAAR